jgi:hypothetical protein
MLDALEEPGALTIAELTGVTGLTTRRAHAVVNSLADRGLVFINREALGWKGTGEYGPLIKRSWIEHAQEYGSYAWIDLNTVPTVLVKKGERSPGTVDEETAHAVSQMQANVMRQRTNETRRAARGMPEAEKEEYQRTQERRYAALDREQAKRKPRTVGKDTEFIHIGVPVYGLMVWATEARRQWRAQKVAELRTGRAMFKAKAPTEAELIERYGPAV